jgi:hypothetical protein
MYDASGINEHNKAPLKFANPKTNLVPYFRAHMPNFE